MASEMTAEKVAVIQRRTNRTSREPWYVFENDRYLLVRDRDGNAVCRVSDIEFATPKQQRYAEFIAHARSDIPALVEALRAARAERDAFERDYTAVGERNKEIHDQYFVLVAALPASEAARRRAEEESAVRGACLRALRARLPQPTLDDLCDWQRDRIDAVLGRTEPPAENDLLAIGIDRETLGRIVREQWLAWQRAKPNPKPENLRTWEELDEGAREIEMRMGEAVATHVLGGRPADGLREAVDLALADLRAALSMNDDPYVEEIIDHAANLLGAGMRGAGEGAAE